MNIFSAVVCLLSIGTFVSASSLTTASPYPSLTAGKYQVGYTRLSAQCGSAANPQKKINLVLNIRYPAVDTNATRMRLADYTSTHQTINVSGTDSLSLAKITTLRNSLRKWHGEFTDESWQKFLEQPANAFINAKFHKKKISINSRTAPGVFNDTHK